MKKIINIAAVLIGGIAGALAGVKYEKKIVLSEQKEKSKFKGYYNLLNHWLTLKYEGKNFDQYFADNHYRKIAIYGMGDMGQRLCEELKGGRVEILCGIDKNAEMIYSDIDVITPDQEIRGVDAVIVTSTYYFVDIFNNLKDKVDCPIISLEDVIYDLL